MSRVPSFILRMVIVAIILSFGLVRMKAQEPASAVPKQETSKPEQGNGIYGNAIMPGADVWCASAQPADRLGSAGRNADTHGCSRH